MENLQEEKEFAGNVKVCIEKGKVRVWVCSDETGQCMFRFMSRGSVINGETGLIVSGETIVDRRKLISKGEKGNLKDLK